MEDNKDKKKRENLLTQEKNIPKKERPRKAKYTETLSVGWKKTVAKKNIW